MIPETNPVMMYTLDGTPVNYVSVYLDGPSNCVAALHNNPKYLCMELTYLNKLAII